MNTTIRTAIAVSLLASGMAQARPDLILSNGNSAGAIKWRKTDDV